MPASTVYILPETQGIGIMHQGFGSKKMRKESPNVGFLKDMPCPAGLEVPGTCSLQQEETIVSRAGAASHCDSLAIPLSPPSPGPPGISLFNY